MGNLPSGYTELKYIECTGTQYIDTGLRGTQNTRLITNFRNDQTSNSAIFGADGGWQINGFGIWVNTNIIAPVFGSKTGSVGLTFGSDLDKIQLDSTGVLFNDSLVWSASEVTPFTTPTNIAIGAVNRSETIYELFVGRIGKTQIYEDGLIVRDFAPCINPNDVVGFYDKVTKTFYGNSGTGAFVAGPVIGELPVGYTQLEYIESTGTQYIDTGFKPNQDTRVVCVSKIQKQEAAAWLFGARNGGNVAAFGFLTFRNNYRTDYNAGPNPSISDDYTDVFELDKNKNITSINGATKATASYGNFQCNYPLILFANNDGGNIGGYAPSGTKISTCQIYSNGVLIRDFAPCRNAEGTIGLYDLENGVFYENAGTGAFTAGPEVIPPAPTVYVKVNGVWKPASDIYAKSGGTWKAASDIFVKSGAVWQADMKIKTM